jgi:hypothetical protein
MKWVKPVALFGVILAGCSSNLAGIPGWVGQLTRTFQNEPVGNPPQSIWRYEYQGKIVYFVPAQCCDQFSQLFDASGNLICAPDGGFTGQGDGLCPDFFTLRTGETLIWKDPRSR